MARVDRMIGQALIMMADSEQTPKWNEAEPDAAEFLEAWKNQGKK